MFRIIVVVVILGLLATAMKPAEVGLSWFQKFTQFMVNRLDPNYAEIETEDQTMKMRNEKLYCYKDSDCILVMCGARPNQSSFSVNSNYLLNQTDTCRQEGDAYWDGYTRCKQNICEYNRLIIPWSDD